MTQPTDKPRRLMKDGLDRTAVCRMAAALAAVHDAFDAEGFERDALAGLPALELKERVRHLVSVLGCHLPPDYPEAAGLLRRIPRVWLHGDENDPLRGFAAWPIIDYSATYGLAHPTLALDTLAALTPLFSAEFAVRTFLLHHPAVTFASMEKWVASPDHHVRRLVSEGTRPRLPWAMRVPSLFAEPQRGLALLERLVDDESEYVRRSVANHINDVAKNHPELAVETCERWLRERGNERRRWVVERGMRSLVKAGHPKVWSLLGHTDAPEVEVPGFRISPDVLELGGELLLKAEIASLSSSTQNLVVDYAVHFVKANGKTSPKVFKGRNICLPGGATVMFEKRQGIKAITTRRYYPGHTLVELLVNGKVASNAAFELKVI